MNNSTLLAAACLALGLVAPASAAYVDTVLNTPGLVGYWRLDEASGNAQDQTANNNDGVYSGTVQRQQSGPSASDGFAGFGATNHGAGFGGNTSHVTVADNDILDIRTGDLSIEAWLWIDPNAALGSLNTAVVKMGSSTGNAFRDGYNLAFRETLAGNDVNRFDGNARSETASGATVGSSPKAQGAWHHVVMVIHPDRNAGTTDGYAASGWTLYVNGVQDGTAASAILDGLDINSEQPLRFGEWNDNTSNLPFPYFGRIDEVAIYNRALSAADIAGHYQAAIPEPASIGLLAAAGLLVLARRA